MKPQAHAPEEDLAKARGRAANGPLSLVELSAVLTALQAQEPGCILTAFGDLNARLVLRAEPAGAWPQEALDDLCAQACEAFDLARGVSEQSVVAPIIALAPGQTRLFVPFGAAQPGDSAEAFLIVCDTLPTVRRVELKLGEKLHALGLGTIKPKGGPCAR